MKKLQLPPRSPQRTRFQTALGGATCVPTVMEAHFDAYAEAPQAPALSRSAMETVPRVTVAPAATNGNRAGGNRAG